MKKIVVLTGCSGSGKDYILRELVFNYKYRNLVSVTTRPKREGEIEGKDYLFKSNWMFKLLIMEGYFIEHRKYRTLLNGEENIWYYGLPKQELDLENRNYVVILDLDGAKSFVNYYGKENCVVFNIQCSAEERRNRAINRGGYDETEFNRRLEADKIDFSEEKINEICDKIVVNENKNIKDVVKEIINV